MIFACPFSVIMILALLTASEDVAVGDAFLMRGLQAIGPVR